MVKEADCNGGVVEWIRPTGTACHSGSQSVGQAVSRRFHVCLSTSSVEHCETPKEDRITAQMRLREPAALQGARTLSTSGNTAGYCK